MKRALAVLLVVAFFALPVAAFGAKGAASEEEVAAAEEAALDEPVVDDEVETDDEATEEAAEILGSTLSSRYALLDALVASEEGSGNAIATGTQMLVGVNRALDGATVSFSAEAVGEVLAAGSGHVWVNMAGDGSTTLGVYMTEEAAAQIDTLGSWRATGTTLLVEGVYHVACEEHEGELDVHATSVTVVASGVASVHVVSEREQMFAAGLCGLGAALTALYLALSFIFNRKKKK